MNPIRTVLLAFFFFAGWAGPSPQEAPPTPRIDAPVPGEALQGVVSVLGSTALESFQSAELAFGYGRNPTGTWFLIQQMSQPIESGALGAWDTTVISDGEYTLRLLVYQTGGETHEVILTGLRVRNYSIIETNTPVPATPNTPLPTSLATPTLTLAPTQPLPGATVLPANPAQVTPANISRSLMLGSAAAAGLFLALGLYVLVRWLAQR